VQNIYAGEEITILTQADKIGKTLGYASLEVLNQNGELLARGKHIKHLNMGPWFDFITHPVIAPISLALHEFTHKRENAKKEKEGNNDVHKVTGFPTLEGVGKVFDILGLTRFLSKVPSAEADVADNNMFCSDSGRVDPAEVKSYTMTVKQMTSNLNRTMHGGAVGCAVEHACLLSRSRNTQSDGRQEGREGVYDMDCYIQSLEVRYISPMRGDLIITTANDRHSPRLYTGASSAQAGSEEAARWCTKSLGKVLNKSDGSVCAEYVCTWALH
jgi:acyl-coenzyme A thioesterase PaaI-like protein